ncbi:MAG: S24 family peptidase [Kordiimonadaceae bacterium]|nr:S24 family peptidase [Kordiimonadaceae bacterium]
MKSTYTSPFTDKFRSRQTRGLQKNTEAGSGCLILPTPFTARQSNRIFGFKKDLPIMGRAQGGEEGNLVIEDHAIDWTFRPADLQGVHSAFAVFVTGNSMVPKFKNQDLAYIHPSQALRKNRFVLIETVKHGGFIKQFKKWDGDTLVLEQFNPAKEITFQKTEILSVMLVIGSIDA